MINEKSSKEKVMRRKIVNVDVVKAAVAKLKQINLLYKKVDEQTVDDAAKEVIETVASTTSTMLVKATKKMCPSFRHTQSAR